jgi:hypothetical protein
MVILLPDPAALQPIHRDGRSYRVVDDEESLELATQLALATDAGLFEFRSYLELLAHFAYSVLKKTDRAPSATVVLSTGDTIDIIRNGKLNTHGFLHYLCERVSQPRDWFDFLARHRNFFTHRGAPYLTIEVLQEQPARYDFLVARKPIADFVAADPKDFFRLSDLNSVIAGVVGLRREVQQYLVGLFEV